MDSDIIIAIIGFFGLATTSIGTLIAKDLIDKNKANRRDSFKRIIPDLHRVYHHLHEVVSRCKSTRAMVLYTENGGGIPSPRSDLFVTVSFEAHNGTQPIREICQRQPCDEEYIKMLGVLLNSDYLVVQADLMPPCMLKDLYSQTGTKVSLLFIVCRTQTKFHYCSFNFKEDTPITKEVFQRCKLEATAIKDIFSKDQQRKKWFLF